MRRLALLVLVMAAACAKRPVVHAPVDLEAPPPETAKRAPEMPALPPPDEGVEPVTGMIPSPGAAPSARFAPAPRIVVFGEVPGRPPGGGERGPPASEDVARLRPVVEQVLDAYPMHQIGHLLRELWLVGRLRTRGQGWNGLAHPRAGVLEIALRAKTTPRAVVRVMHHELAHLAAYHPEFDLDAWRAFSAGEYVGRGNVGSWRGRGDRAWLEAGFVSAYASVNAQEDFAELAELAFTDPRRARRLAGRVPRIAEKLLFLTAHYVSVMPDLELPWATRSDLDGVPES